MKVVSVGSALLFKLHFFKLISVVYHHKVALRRVNTDSARRRFFLYFSLNTLVSKLFFLAVQGSGALLSSNLEGALYKSP